MERHTSNADMVAELAAPVRRLSRATMRSHGQVSKSGQSAALSAIRSKPGEPQESKDDQPATGGCRAASGPRPLGGDERLITHVVGTDTVHEKITSV